ncbi:protein-glutamate O-methyltransferase CheR [Catenovulum sp. SM1970]|uniref:CheR family methyltransferase n=1 Tax=Marinifaba aquimaris TaxID=2741323 RepID=UPI001574B896|nr:protein-glutamate O-methyltransferase CheR [Marinifaba aquimaris]
MSHKNLADADYQKFCTFLEHQCGIVLGANKQYLVKSRLTPLMARFSIETLSELLDKAIRVGERQLRAAVVDAMTTNETLWFRDTYPFDVLKKDIFPHYGNKRIKFWSAASSSGQEAYSIAISALEHRKANPAQANIQILGSDISPTMLDICRFAEYDSLALGRGLSPDRKRNFFNDIGNGRMQLKPEVKSLASFRQVNLLDSYSLLGKFDVIFCRNVLIYFSAEVKSKILSQFAQSLNPDGYLFLGASESITGLSDEFVMQRCNPGIVYRKK